MKKLWMLALAVLLVPVGGLKAQQRDSMRQRGDTVEAGRLRARIDSMFGRRVAQELKLTPDQATKLRASQEKFGARRRDIMAQQFARRRALDDQMQPGIAANSDSVRKLLDGVRNGRADMVKLEQDEDQELSGYLTPVQRARYQQMRERFMQRVNEMRQERRGERGGPMRRPGIRAGRRRGI